MESREYPGRKMTNIPCASPPSPHKQTASSRGFPTAHANVYACMPDPLTIFRVGEGGLVGRGPGAHIGGRHQDAALPVEGGLGQEGCGGGGGTWDPGWNRGLAWRLLHLWE